MNIFAPQSELSLAEHTEILSVEANFTTGQHSRPIIAMKQDAMTGGYILTYGDVKIDKATFFDCLALEYFEFDIMEKYNHILNVYKWKGVFDIERTKLTQDIEQLKINCQILKEKFTHNTTKINLIINDKDFDKLTKSHASNKKKYQDILLKKETETDAEELEIINAKIEHYEHLIQESTKKIEKILTTTQNSDVKKIVQINQQYKRDYNDILDKIEYYEDNFDQEVEDRLMLTGRTLFSFLLPDDFEYYFNNDISPDGKQVDITRGVLMSGTLNKAVIGSSAGSISHVLFLQYSAKKACDFVSYYQMIINRWLMTRGLSVGIEDCVPKFINRKDDIHLVKKKDEERLNDYRKRGYKIVDFTRQSFMCVKEITTDVSNPIETTSAKSFSNALLTIQTEEDEELLELKINNALNNARDMCQKLAKEALEPTNSFVTIIRSGAKGNDNNITQITSMLGQQNMEGQRMQLTFGGRTLPHFKKNWEEIAKTSEMAASDLKMMFEARGFVTSSFYKGLTPSEFYFHAVGGREGVIDTACKTAKTGYTQRKMIKKMEDLKVNYLGMVETSNKNIISFDYGGDNYDGAKIIYKKGTPLFVDVESVVAKLNCDYEWQQYTQKYPMKTNIEIVEESKEDKPETQNVENIKKVEKDQTKKEQKIEKIEKIQHKRTSIHNKPDQKDKKRLTPKKISGLSSKTSDSSYVNKKSSTKKDKPIINQERTFDTSIKKEDIKIFFTKKYKNTNKIDISNKLRESIIININLIPDDYINDSEFGEDWRTLKQSWNTVVSCDYNVDKYVGRNRYNFVLSNTKDEKDIVYVEFKHNMESVYKLPDIINLKACSDIMSASYEEYYYKNFLQKVCKEAEIETSIPELSVYLDTIYKDKTTDPFFTELKEKVCLKEECDEIISDSIYTFMKANLKKTNIQALRREIEECFKKEYIFWNSKSNCFERQKIVETFEHMKVDNVRNQNTIVVKTKMHEYHMLLRWKNKKGVLYPCWQVAVKKN